METKSLRSIAKYFPCQNHKRPVKTVFSLFWKVQLREICVFIEGGGLNELGSNLRVALVSGEYPPASLGGTAAVCFDLSLNLSKKNIGPDPSFAESPKKLSVEKVNDYLDVVRMPIISPPPRHLWFPLQNLSLLRGYLKDFDIIHNVDPKTGGVFASFKKELRSPFITHVHGCTHCETNVFLGSPIPFWSAGEFVGSVLEYPLNEYLLNSSLRASDSVCCFVVMPG